jgi:glycosyltransferase involved in cell wall biosynthesis
VKIAVLFDMLGPYHVARLEALGASNSVVAVEIAARSRIYSWTPVEARSGFVRETLFDVDDSSRLDDRRIHRVIFETLDRHLPEIVFIPGWSARAALAALRWCLARRRPSVVMSETTRWDHPRIAWREMVKRGLAQLFSAGLVGGAPHRDYLAELGMPRRAIALGYDVVDNPYFSVGASAARARGDELRGRLGLPGRYFLASARFVPVKNLAGLLEAFARFRSLRPESSTALVLLGDGEGRAALEARRDALGLKGIVLTPGFKQYSELPAYYGLADAFVHVSRVEPWGLVVNEAMAAGLPIVVSRQCGCASTLLREGENGFCVSFDSLEEIAARLAQLDADAALRERMGARSREIIADWGPARFAAGALEAARLAAERGAATDRLVARGLLSALRGA